MFNSKSPFTLYCVHIEEHIYTYIFALSINAQTDICELQLRKSYFNNIITQSIQTLFA